VPEEIELDVKCPFQDCPSKKTIKVPSYVFDNKAFGTLKIQIAKGTVCPQHQFVVFVDKKGKVRGAEKIDMQIIVAQKPKQEQQINVDLNTIKEMMGEFAIYNIFHAFLLDIPVIIVRKTLDDQLLTQMNLVFKDLFPDLFELKNPLKFVTQEEFKEYKIANVLAIDEKGFIIDPPWQIDNFEFEKENLLQKALEAKDYKAQIIIFKQIVSNLMKKVEVVQGMLSSDKKVIYSEDVKSRLEKEFMIKKVGDYDITLIKEILKFRFLMDVSKITMRSLNTLKAGIW
jgi:hypothetical protein